MLGIGKKRGEAPKLPSNQPSDPLNDVVSGFPRGLPDGDKLKPLATARWPSADEVAARLDRWRPGLFLLGRDQTGRYFGHGDDRHILTVAGSRSGKGVSLIVPNLLYYPGSCLAIDPKGELATITASRRSAGGSEWSQAMDPGKGKVFVLDPFGNVTGPAVRFRASFNPLADLDPDTERGFDLAWQIADALIIQAVGDGAHWTQSARTFLFGLVLYVAKAEREAPASKNLIRLRHLLTQGRKGFTDMLADMAGMGGLIGRSADSLNSRPPVEKWSVISTCETHTAFLEGPSMERVLTGSDFRLEEMKADRVTVYLCLPATRLATHGRWLRMIVSLAIDAMERTGPIERGRPPVLFCLDEFAAMGHMASIESAAGQIASFGVKLWPVLQDIPQLQRDYKAGWETFMGNSGLLTFFNNTDLTTTENISKRLGDTEVIRVVESVASGWNRSTGGSRPDMWSGLAGEGSGSESSGSTDSGGHNYNQQVMRGPLMNPNEIASLFSRDAGNILCSIPHPDLPPFALYRCAYFRDKGPDADLFGGLYDPAPEQAPPHTKAAGRVERDTARLWHVPVFQASNSKQDT